MSVENWEDEYIYSDIHEVLFVEFPIILYEWLTILATRETNIQRIEAIEWNDQLVYEVTSVSNAISRAIDFWVESILQGYITEFAVDTITSYSEEGKKISKDPKEGIFYLSVHGSRCSPMRRVSCS